MTNIAYELMRKRQALNTKVYGILCLVLILAVGLFSYFKWNEYVGLNALFNKSSSLVTNLRENLNETNANYAENKEDFADLKDDIESRLAYIFPATDDYTALTRQFDDYENELAKVNDPFEVSHIDYQSPVEEGEYTILPVRMSIISSAENFQKFLHLIETSGALDEQVRLMDISSIRLNFESGDKEDAGPEMINFTVQINAYFQKTIQ